MKSKQKIKGGEKMKRNQVQRMMDWIKLTCSVPRFYSYKPLLIKLLKENSPKTILEWGCGQSTKLMKQFCPTAEIHSIEHDWRWYIRQKISINSQIHLIPLNKGYATPDFPENYFDFIFVDAKKEVIPDCTRTALKLVKDDGLILLHDARKVKGKINYSKNSLGHTLLLRKNDEPRFSDEELDY